MPTRHASRALPHPGAKSIDRHDEIMLIAPAWTRFEEPKFDAP